MKNKVHWLNEKPIKGTMPLTTSGEVLIVGSGLAGVSTAYWLQKHGFQSLTLVDDDCEQAASFRNCGHILHGTVESMEALIALYGEEKAQMIWQFSVEICNLVRQSVDDLGVDVEYHQDGYLCLAVDKIEAEQLTQSAQKLRSCGFSSDFWSQKDVQELGFKNVYGGRYEPGSAQAHPVKFRNAILQSSLEKGLQYTSGVRVLGYDVNGRVHVDTNRGVLKYDALVLATNAYSAMCSNFFKTKKLIEPFRGQIIASRPLSASVAQKIVSYPHSFNRGYEYALLTEDRRLLLGGWRDEVDGQEVGCFDLQCNPVIENGLKDFAQRHYDFDVEWEYGWSGVMGSSQTGLPFIGPTQDPQVFTCAGFTGHGFSWAHGSAKLLADMMAGVVVPPYAQFFNPCL